jgi:DNA-binding beta-propeller fold protein YncE
VPVKSANEIVVASDGTNVYVANYVNNVSLINTVNNTVTVKVLVGYILCLRAVYKKNSSYYYLDNPANITYRIFSK